jgi:hypothetical protein
MTTAAQAERVGNIVARFGVPTIAMFILLYFVLVAIPEKMLPVAIGLTDSVRNVSISLDRMQRALDENTTRVVAHGHERAAEHAAILDALRRFQSQGAPNGQNPPPR